MVCSWVVPVEEVFQVGDTSYARFPPRLTRPMYSPARPSGRFTGQGKKEKMLTVDRALSGAMESSSQ